jgi:anti-sigma B factor antagonist
VSPAIDDAGAGGDRHVVTCRGELDLHTAPDLRERLVGAIEGGKQDVVVDLTEVTFLDSTILTVLMQRRRELTDRGGRLALVGVRPEVRLIFEIAGLDRAIPDHPSVAAAFAAPRA